MSTSGKSVYVIGAGGHGKVVVRTLQELGFVVAGVFDDSPEKATATLCGVAVAGPTEKLAHLGRVSAVIAIGDNAGRLAMAKRFDLDWLSIVHPRAFVDGSARIGDGTVVLAGAVVQASAIVGNHVIVNTSATVDHDCELADFVHVAPGVHLAGRVVVGEGSFLGIGAVAIPNRTTRAWSIVGAGSTIIKDIPANVVAVGTPACPVDRARSVPTLDEPTNSPTLTPFSGSSTVRKSDGN